MSNVLTLNDYINLATEFYNNTNSPIPNTVKEWSKLSVRKGEIPPGMSYQKLTKDKISLVEVLKAINPNNRTRKVEYSPITAENIEALIGLKWLGVESLDSGHRSVSIECMECLRVESLDYGTLQRMRAREDKYCRHCREVGGKPKDLDIYDRFEGFKLLNYDNKVCSYKCLDCATEISRSLSTVLTAEYLSCNNCKGSITTYLYNTEYGNFHSKMELESYKVLLKYFTESDILRQITYDSLFNTGTKHSLDFFVPSIDLKLEVTTANNNLSKYNETVAWKKQFKVEFAYTLKEVNDIVRSYMKV